MGPNTPFSAPGPLLRRTDLAQVEIDRSLVLYDAANGKAHLLNSSAAIIWHLLDDLGSLAALEEAVLDLFEVSQDQAARDCREVIQYFHDNGLLVVGDAAVQAEGLPEPAISKPVDKEPIDHHDSQELQDDRSTTVGPFDALGYVFDIAGDPDLVASLNATLAALASNCSAAHRYSIGSPPTGDDRYSLHLDGKLLLTSESTVVTSHLLWHVNHSVCAEPSSHLLMHASAILTPTGVIAFAGEPDAGKSTLVTELIRRGSSYVTDEALGIDIETLEVIAYPKPVGVDQGSWQLFPDLAGATPALSTNRWWLDANLVAERAGSPARSVDNMSRHQIRALVFLNFDQSATQTTASHLASDEATMMAARNLFNLAAHHQAGLDAIARVVVGTPCYELCHNGLDGAIAWLNAEFDTLE